MASLLSPPPSPGAAACSSCLLSPRLTASPSFGDAASRSALHFPLPSSVPLLLAPSPRSRQHRQQERLAPPNAVRGSFATVETCEQQTMSEPPSLYAVLGISQTASFSEIKSAYRQMARRYHPDVHPGSENGNGSQMFLQVREAYDILSDTDLRADYDYSLLHPFSAHAFGKGFAPSSMARRRRGDSNRSDVSGAWKPQWEAQLNRLHQKQDMFSSNESWGARMRRRSQESN